CGPSWRLRRPPRCPPPTGSPSPPGGGSATVRGEVLMGRRLDASGWLAAALGIEAATACDLSLGDLAVLARTGIGHRICYAVPQAALAEGWRTSVEEDDENDVNADLDER